MTQLSASQIASVVKEAGWPLAEIPLAVAIVLAESGGHTDSRGDVSLMSRTWGPSIGLFQIRSVNSEKGKGTTRDEIANLDPHINARHALEIRRSQGLGAWSVFNTGAYKQHMAKGLLGAANPLAILPGIPDIPNPLSGAADALSSVRDLLTAITSGQLAMRALMVIGGFYMMFLAVLMMFFGSSAGDTTIRIGKTVAKAVVAKKVAV